MLPTTKSLLDYISITGRFTLSNETANLPIEDWNAIRKAIYGRTDVRGTHRIYLNIHVDHVVSDTVKQRLNELADIPYGRLRLSLTGEGVSKNSPLFKGFFAKIASQYHGVQSCRIDAIRVSEKNLSSALLYYEFEIPVNRTHLRITFERESNFKQWAGMATLRSRLPAADRSIDRCPWRIDFSVKDKSNKYNIFRFYTKSSYLKIGNIDAFNCMITLRDKLKCPITFYAKSDELRAVFEVEERGEERFKMPANFVNEYDCFTAKRLLRVDTAHLSCTDVQFDWATEIFRHFAGQPDVRTEEIGYSAMMNVFMAIRDKYLNMRPALRQASRQAIHDGIVTQLVNSEETMAHSRQWAAVLSNCIDEYKTGDEFASCFEAAYDPVTLSYDRSKLSQSIKEQCKANVALQEKKGPKSL